MNKLSLTNVDCADKRVVLRVDFNVPMKDGKITDTTRIDATVPTIEHILKQNPKTLIILSHLGRPDGKRKAEFSLKPIVPTLQERLGGHAVAFAEDFDKIRPEDPLVLFENIRFWPEEEGKGASADDIRKFCEKLTALCDVFVNDAFGAAHRAHASIVGIKAPVRAAGLLMSKELDAFNKVLHSPERPLLAIVGGAKIFGSDGKIALLENLLEKVDELVIGGGMAFTFLKVVKGFKIGNSLFDEKGAGLVQNIMAKAEQKGVKIHLPVDYIIADKFAEDAQSKVCDGGDIPDGWMGLDIGPDSINEFAQVVERAKTIVWNGPMGVFEWEPYAAGSKGVLAAVKQATHANGATSIVGGGDTAACVQKYGQESDVTHISTGGGASLELLEGKTLPGIAILSAP